MVEKIYFFNNCCHEDEANLGSFSTPEELVLIIEKYFSSLKDKFEVNKEEFFNKLLLDLDQKCFTNFDNDDFCDIDYCDDLYNLYFFKDPEEFSDEFYVNEMEVIGRDIDREEMKNFLEMLDKIDLLGKEDV
jgi:hypothetical protein